MKKDQIIVGGHYSARISGHFVTVKVDAIHEVEQRRTSGNTAFGGRGKVYPAATYYDITNLRTGPPASCRRRSPIGPRRNIAPTLAKPSCGPIGPPGLTNCSVRSRCVRPAISIPKAWTMPARRSCGCATRPCAA